MLRTKGKTMMSPRLKRPICFIDVAELQVSDVQMHTSPSTPKSPSTMSVEVSQWSVGRLKARHCLWMTVMPLAIAWILKEYTRSSIKPHVQCEFLWWLKTIPLTQGQFSTCVFSSFAGYHFSKIVTIVIKCTWRQVWLLVQWHALITLQTKG